MPRNLYDPANSESSIRKLSSARGAAFTYIYRYLLDPASPQTIPPLEGKPWYLKNMRSDLSAWRAGLAQVPSDRLLTIPWLGLLALTRQDLAPLAPEASVATLLEDLRMFTTQLRPEGLHIGSQAHFTSLPAVEPAFTNAPQKTAPEPATVEPEAEANPLYEHLLDRLHRLEKEERALQLKTGNAYTAKAEDHIRLQLVQEEIAHIKERIS